MPVNPNYRGRMNVESIESYVADLQRQITADLGGDVMSDGSVPITGVQTFTVGLQTPLVRGDGATNLVLNGNGQDVEFSTRVKHAVSQIRNALDTHVGDIAAGATTIQWGDVGAAGNSTILTIDDAAQLTTIASNAVSVDGVGAMQIGDVSAAGNNVLLTINDGTDTATLTAATQTFTATTAVDVTTPAFDVDGTGTHRIGDISAAGNSVLLTVNDTGDQITMDALHMNLNLVAHANDAAAGVAGLVTNDLYKIGDTVTAKQ